MINAWFYFYSVIPIMTTEEQNIIPLCFYRFFLKIVYIYTHNQCFKLTDRYRLQCNFHSVIVCFSSQMHWTLSNCLLISTVSLLRVNLSVYHLIQIWEIVLFVYSFFFVLWIVVHALKLHNSPCSNGMKKWWCSKWFNMPNNDFIDDFWEVSCQLTETFWVRMFHCKWNFCFFPFLPSFF